MPKMLPVKQKMNWRLWVRLAVWSMGLGGIALGAHEVNAFLRHDSRFELACGIGEPACSTLEIRGAVHSNKARMQSVFTEDFGGSVFRIPLAERRRHLLAVDWVGTASIERVWPNRLVVTVTERTPVAFAKLPMGDTARYRLALIDGEGVLLPIPGRVRFHLPVLSGVTEEQSEADRRLRVKAAQNLLDELGPEAKEISEVNAGNPRDMRVVTGIDGHAVELWMGDQRFRARYQNFMSHYAEMRKHSEEAGVFDLRMDDRILAK